MLTKKQWRAFIDSPVVEWSIFGLGVLLLILAIPVGALPGPGGIIVAGLGLALVLKTSMWAKRRYARFKRWRPKVFGRRVAPGRWTDWALRRRTELRRRELEKQRQSDGIEKSQPN